MRLKTAIVLSFLAMRFSLLFSVDPAWGSVISENQETKAIAELLKVYRAYDDNGPLQLRRIGKDYDGGYVVPDLAIQESDIVFGYGIFNDISLEDTITRIYGKPS